MLLINLVAFSQTVGNTLYKQYSFSQGSSYLFLQPQGGGTLSTIDLYSGNRFLTPNTPYFRIESNGAEYKFQSTSPTGNGVLPFSFGYPSNPYMAQFLNAEIKFGSLGVSFIPYTLSTILNHTMNTNFSGRGPGGTSTKFYSSDYQASTVNTDGLELVTNATDGIKFKSFKSGTGTLRPLSFHLGDLNTTTSGSLLFNVDGSIKMGGSGLIGFRPIEADKPGDMYLTGSGDLWGSTFTMYNTDYEASQTNFSGLRFTSNDIFGLQISSVRGGTGTLQPIFFNVGSKSELIHLTELGNVKFGGAGSISFRPTSGANTLLDTYMSGKGTGGTKLSIYSTDFEADATNWSGLQLTGNETSGFSFSSIKGGTGTLRPLSFNMDTNTNALLFNADGSIKIGGSTASVGFRPTGGTNTQQNTYLTGKGTGGAQLTIYNTDFEASQTNWEGMQIKSGATSFDINSANGGTGTLRPITLGINGAKNLTLNTDGSFAQTGSLNSVFGMSITNTNTGAGAFTRTSVLNDAGNLSSMQITGSTFTNSGLFANNQASFLTTAGVGSILHVAQNTNASEIFAIGGGATTNERFRISNTGVGVSGIQAPTAKLHIAAGTTAASSAPIKIASGTLMTTPEAGAIEFTGSLFVSPTAGTRHRIFHGFIGTAALDFPAATATTVSELNVTMNGVALGDVIMLGVPNASMTATGMYFARVSAANTVTIRFSPKAAEDPALGTFTITCIK